MEKNKNLTIPGFYYDENKKKYFKICKSKFSYTENVINEDRLNSIQVEKKRLLDLKSHSCLETNSATTLQSTFKKREYDSISIPFKFVHDVNKILYSSLRHHHHFSLFQEKDCYSSKISFNKSGNSFAVIDKYVGNFYAIDFDYKINNLWRNISECTIKNPMFGTKVLSHSSLSSKIAAFCWLNENLVAVFTNPQDFSSKSLCMFINKHTGSMDYGRRFASYIQSGTIDITGQMMAISFDNGLKMLSLNNATPVPTFRDKTKKPPYISMDFSKNDKVLYLGDKEGCLKYFDCRSNTIHSIGKCSGNVHITNLYSSFNGHYLLSQSTNGKIYLWDVRMKKTVLEYLGHIGSHNPLPLHVDPNEEFISIVGLDGYTRIWDFQTSQQLNTIPPPAPTHNIVPAISFLPQDTSPGLIMLLKNKFYVYAF